MTSTVSQHGCDVGRDRDSGLITFAGRRRVERLRRKDKYFVLRRFQMHDIPGEHTWPLNESQFMFGGGEDTCRDFIRMIVRNEVDSTRTFWPEQIIGEANIGLLMAVFVDLFPFAANRRP